MSYESHLIRSSCDCRPLILNIIKVAVFSMQLISKLIYRINSNYVIQGQNIGETQNVTKSSPRFVFTEYVNLKI